MNRLKYIHFIGISGYGMSGIANILLLLHYKVSGSDLRETPITRRLQNLGAKIFLGHHESNIENVSMVIVSSAIPFNNPEVKKANELGIPIYNRAEMLSEIMNGSFSIAIAGTHGKTSTTSLIGCILETAGFDPTVVIGGEVAVFGGNSKLGFGSHVVVEADESDGSLLYLSPRFAVITNIDNDHMDYYQDANHLDKTFLAFIHRVDHDGLVVLCSDCERTRQLIPDIKRKIVTYGFDPEHAVFTARNIQLNVDGSKFSLYRRSRYLYDVSLAVPGRHSILNTLAAIAISEALNVPVPSILQALATFSGAGRRFQTIGEHKEIKIIDDYAHHPTEVKVTMETAKQVCEGRIISVFQPHRYTRTKQFSKEFAQALLSGDLVIIDQIYAASEEPIEGINSELLVSLMKEAGHKNVMHLSGAEAITTYLLENLQPKDLVLTIGAGDITYLGPSLLAKLKEGNVDSKVTFAA